MREILNRNLCKLQMFFLLLFTCVATTMAHSYKVGERKNKFTTGDKVFIYSTCMVGSNTSRCGIIKNAGTNATFENVVLNSSYTNDGSAVWTVEVLETTSEYTKVAFKTLEGKYWGIDGATNNNNIATNQTFYLVNYTSETWKDGQTIISSIGTGLGIWCGGDVLGQDENFNSVAPANLTLEHKLYAVVAGNGNSINTDGGSYKSTNQNAYPIAFYEAEVEEKYEILGLKEIPTNYLNLNAENLTTGYYLIKNTNSKKNGALNQYLYRNNSETRFSNTPATNNANYIWHVTVNNDGTFSISTANNELYWPLPSIGNVTLSATANNLKYTTNNDSYNNNGTNDVNGTGSCLIYSDAVNINGNNKSYFHINDGTPLFLGSWYDTNPNSLLYAQLIPIEPNMMELNTYITDLSQLSNTSVYTITPANTASTGAICAKEGDETKLYITYFSGASVNSNDPYQQFAIFNCNGKYFLYNVGAQKFVKKDGARTALTENVTIENEFVFETSNKTPDSGHNYVQADYPWCIVFEGMPLCATSASHQSEHGGLLTNWDSNGDSGTVLEIMEVDTDVESLAEAYERVEAYIYAATTVTYRYMFNGVEVATENLPAAVGKQLPTPVKVPVGYTAEDLTGRNVATANEVVEVLITFTGYPFEFSETVENIEHWYYIQMHSNQKKYIQYVDGANYIEWADAALTAEEEDLYTWAFVGTPEQGFKLVNFALGTEYALNSNGSGDPVMASFDTGACWKPVNSNETGNEGYFCLQYPGGNYMNGQSGKVAFWSSADAGSTILVTERVIEERNISVNVVAQGNGDVSIKGKIGTEAKFANGSNATVIATVNRGYIFKGWQKDGETVSTAASYSFVVSENVSYTAIFVPKLAQTTVLDFTTNEWGIPKLIDTENTEGVKTRNSYTDGENTIEIDPVNGYFYYDTSGYLVIAKSGTKITLPAFDFDVAKIEVVGNPKASSYPNADMNVYVGNSEVSTACSGSTGTNVFEIAGTAQTAGTIYELKIGDGGGEYSSVIYISYIKVYPKDGLVAPVFDVASGVYTQALTVNISSPTAEKDNVTNVVYYYMKSATEPTADFKNFESPILIDETSTLTAVVQLDYYGITYRSETTSIEYIISELMIADKISSPEVGDVYIAVDEAVAAPYNALDKKSLSTGTAEVNGSSIRVAEYYAYTLEDAGEGRFYLKDVNGNYIASSGTSSDFNSTKSISGTSASMFAWTISVDESGNATLANGAFVLVYDNEEFKMVSSDNIGTATLPKLYGDVKNTISVKLNSIANATLIAGFEKNGLATFSAPFPTLLPEGVTAYYAEEGVKENDCVSLVAFDGITLPADEGFILMGDPGTIEISLSYDNVESLEGLNKLGNTANAPKYLAANSCYLLGNGSQGPGFYACSGGTLAQYKAYLDIAAGASRSIVIRFPGTTGIDDVHVHGENMNVEGIYDLTGRKIEEITTPGIYIINGKKLLVK